MSSQSLTSAFASHQQRPTKHQHRTMRAGIAATGLVTAATLLGYQFNNVHHHYHAQLAKHRMLTSVQEASSLQVHVSVKRDSMQMFGSSEYSLIATPVITTEADGSQSVRYNGVTAFMKDGVQHTYRLVDGVTYYQTKNQQAGFAQESTECLTASSLPPVKDMLEALNAAKPITKVDSSESISCEGKLLSTSLGGSPFVICAGSDVSKGFKVYGSDFNVDVTYLSSKIEIPKPSMSAEQADACAKTPAAAKVTTSTANLITGTTSGAVSQVLSNQEATAVLPKATCTCAGAKRPCLFIHGLGQKTDGGLADSLDYFGDIKNHAPCCSSIKFALLDTVNNAWYSDTLENKVCNYALSMSSSSSTSTKTVANTIIVTHSMGNLILAGAIASGKCSLASTSSWVGLSGPMIGSMGADYLQTTCANGGLLGGLASLFGGCPANTAIKSMSYEGEKFCPADLKTKYDAAQAAYTSKVSAVMCSNAVDGLLSTDQLVLKLGASVIPHKSSENDGVVEYQSCRAGLATSKFSNTYTSKFYVTKLNHLDTTFRHGDALIQTSQMPVKWFECLF